MKLIFIKPVLAAPVPPTPAGLQLGTLEGLGPLGTFVIGTATAVNLFNKVLSTIVGILTISAGLWFIFQFLIGAFSWLTAGSDKVSLENAQKRIMNSLIGLALVVATIFLVDLVGRIIGLEILSPGKFILSIWTI